MVSTTDGGIQDFLERYKAIRAKQVADEANAVSTALSRVRQEFEIAKRLRSERDQLVAPAFNVFTILGVARKEAAHSKFLGELLDPRGSHGQGSLFLERFIRVCNRFGHFPKAVDIRPSVDRTKVHREATIFNGRCDLLLRAWGQFCILIENKVDAVEGNMQLARYRNWLAKLPEAPENRLLIYLTPRGDSSTSVSEGEYVRLSYVPHLCEWLEECLYEVKAPHVQSVVREYIDVIATLNQTGDADE